MDTKETYLAGKRLSFDLVLVGKIKDYLPYFIVTFKELSQAELGRNRASVELAGVEHVGRDGVTAPAYTKEKKLVRPPADAISWRDLSASDRSTNGSMRSPQAGRVKVARIMLRFFSCRVVPDEERTESGCG
ncbi:MAG: hypothetical protein ACXW6R_02730, partial [Candidatus Binatia bacterium]